MPPRRPSDKGNDDAQWWKNATPEQMEGDLKEGPAANNKDAAGRNKFDQEQEPVKHPV
jgi:hypothetical protein